MRVGRSLTALAAVVPLVWAAAGCSSNPGGTVAASRRAQVVEQIVNPQPGKCHTFVPLGVDRVNNETGMDIRLHVGRDCKDPAGRPSFYLPSTLASTSVPGQALWHSFSTVGWLAPVPAA
jgi:hypothetical protein